MAAAFNNLYICLLVICCISLNGGQTTPGNGTQTTPSPTTVPSCGPPPRILGGLAGVSENGLIANYTCDRGYYMIGQPHVMCQDNGRWAATPTCRVRYCSRPTTIASGSFRYPGGGYIVGTVITFTCNSGYELIDEVGDGTILCLSNFTWTNNTAGCQKKECGEPGDIENGNYTLRTNTTNYQSVVVYTCHEGYTMRSSNSFSRPVTTATLSCTSQGSWSRTPTPSCQPRTCGSPPYVTNTVASSRSRTYYYGDLFDYECAIGYRLVGNTSLSCGKDGEWSLQPVCLLVTCGDPPAVANAVIHSGADKKFNAQALYTCQVGYAARSALSIVCLPNGNWSSVPSCELVNCRKPPQIHNGNVTMLNDTTNYDTHALYECDSGFKLIGIENIRCKSSGDWETPPSCEPSSAVESSCGSPPYVSNMVSSSRRRIYYYGDLFNYECSIGYQLVGNISVTCRKDGTWSLQPVCSPITCGDPPFVANAAIRSGAGTIYNSRVSYTCQVRYAAQGEQSITCLSNGNWSSAPTCELVMCQQPPNIQNGKVHMLNDTSNYETRALYQCNSGFKLIGLENIRCKSNGDWETPPFCETSPGSAGNWPKSNSQVSDSSSGLSTSGPLIGLTIACAVIGLIILALLVFIAIKLTGLKKGGSNWVTMQ